MTHATSILPNSPHTVGKEQTTDFGKFQIDWVPAIDKHVLFYEGPAYGGVIDLAAHHNGHCCQEIIDRVRKGDVAQVKAQIQYILDCGGTAAKPTTLDYIMRSERKWNPSISDDKGFRTKAEKLQECTSTGNVVVVYRVGEKTTAFTSPFRVASGTTNSEVLKLCPPEVRDHVMGFYDVPSHF